VKPRSPPGIACSMELRTAPRRVGVVPAVWLDERAQRLPTRYCWRCGAEVPISRFRDTPDSARSDYLYRTL
jgi:hypothetical protein